MIEIKDVTKVFKGDTYETVALDNVSLKIKNGEFVSIMGKSGSGKSTLLNIIGGMDRPDSGSVTLEGKEISSMKPLAVDRMRQKYIGFVFQHFALIDRYTVYENIEVALDAVNTGRREKKKRIQDVMEQLGIEGLWDKLPSQISGGEKQRTAVARAIVRDNDYILADEPTGALDRENAESLMKIFRELNSAGRTIILVTHDRGVAECTDRIITLDYGKTVSDKKDIG